MIRLRRETAGSICQIPLYLGWSDARLKGETKPLIKVKQDSRNKVGN